MSQNSLTLATTGTVSGLQMTQAINNAIDTLNTLASGASAPSSPEAGQLWHDTTNNLLKIRSLDNTTWVSLFSLNETAYTATPSVLNQVATPQGRLTFNSSASVMTADATAQTSLYYTPYNGANLPLYNGTAFINQIFTTLTLTLNSSAHLSGNVYDVFAFLNGNTLMLAAGPAWTSTTARAAAITQVNGLWVNNASINLTNGTNSYTGIAANKATYLGSFYCTANGQSGIALKPTPVNGGTNNILGLYNAYNRIRVGAFCQDTSSPWTYTSNTVRPANNSTSNRIAFLDGLQQSSILARYSCSIATNTANNGGEIGIGLDSTTSFASSVANASISTNATATVVAELESYPVLGLHYVQALEMCAFYSSGLMEFNNGTPNGLSLIIDM